MRAPAPPLAPSRRVGKAAARTMRNSSRPRSRRSRRRAPKWRRMRRRAARASQAAVTRSSDRASTTGRTVMSFWKAQSAGSRIVAGATLLAFALSGTPASAQAPAPAAPAPSGATQQAAPQGAAQPQGETKTFSKEELEQLVAPIALYPDELFA